MTKKTILFSLLLMLFGISSLAFAHTVIRDQVEAGHSSYNGFVITHGCGFADKPTLGVVAQSVVLPNGPLAIIARADTEAAIPLGDVLVGGMHSSGIINPGAIQDHDVFSVNQELTDETGVVRAIHYRDGFLDPTLTGVMPFRLSGVTFVPESCAHTVRAHIAIANWCHHDAGNRRADVWMGHTTPVFNDADVVSIDFWPTMTINRDVATNPLPETCGEGYEVIVEPSSEAIDQYLPMAGFIPGGPTEGGASGG